MGFNERTPVKENPMFKTIRKSRESASSYLRIANAIRKGQKIETHDTPEGREYWIIINR